MESARRVMNTETGDWSHLVTQRLTSDSVRCSLMHDDCEYVYIRSVTVQEDGVRLEFTAAPDLLQDDILQIFTNVMCDSDCTDAQLSMLKGHYPSAAPVLRRRGSFAKCRA